MNRITRLLCLLIAITVLLSGCSLIPSKTTTTITEEDDVSTDNSTTSSAPSSSSKPLSSSKPQSSSSNSSLNSSSIVISFPENTETNESVPDSEQSEPPVELFQNEEAYKELSDSQKSVYRTIDAMVANHVEGMRMVHAEDMTDISVAYKAVNLDNPNYFWMPHAYIVSQNSSGEYYIAIKYESDEYSLDYLYSKEESELRKREIAQVCENFKKNLKTEDPYEIELAIHDFLCSKISYPSDFNNNNYYNIYGALVEGKAVCEGYSRAMQYLCNLMNIPCILVTGVSHNEGHMWNQVKINGDWYNVDVTWDDPVDTTSTAWHSYFNVSDEVILLDHSFDPLFTSLTDQEINNGETEFNLLITRCDRMEESFAVKNDLLITDNAEFNDVAATNAFLKAFQNNKDHVDLYFSASIDTSQYNIEELYSVFGFNKSFNYANHTHLIKTGKSFVKTTVLMIGCGYRIFFE